MLIVMETLLAFLTQIPDWLEQFDQLEIPTWSVFAALVLAGTALVFAGREFFAWFFKTNAILDELSRVEGQIADLEGDLKALAQAVHRLESTAAPVAPISLGEKDAPNATAQAPAPQAPSTARPQFPLSH
jgi:hypothetical protein